MAAPCVQVQALCVAPAYAAAMAPQAFTIGAPTPDAKRAALIARLGASIDVIFGDCIGCVDIRSYRITCIGKACVAVGGVTLRGTDFSLSWASVARGERLPRHATPIFLAIKATTPATLRAAVGAVALDTDVKGVAVPLNDVLARSGVAP